MARNFNKFLKILILAQKPFLFKPTIPGFHSSIIPIVSEANELELERRNTL
jgi:hypothetical protein